MPPKPFNLLKTADEATDRDTKQTVTALNSADRPLYEYTVLGAKEACQCSGNWRCFACQTWNEPQRDTCMTCLYDRNGNDTVNLAVTDLASLNEKHRACRLVT